MKSYALNYSWNIKKLVYTHGVTMIFLRFESPFCPVINKFFLFLDLRTAKTIEYTAVHCCHTKATPIGIAGTGTIHQYEGMTIKVILSFFHCLVSRQTPENQGIRTVSMYEFCLQNNWMNWDWSLGKNSALIWQQTTKSNVPPGCYVKLCKHEYLGYLILPAEINTCGTYFIVRNKRRPYIH